MLSEIRAPVQLKRPPRAQTPTFPQLEHLSILLPFGSRDAYQSWFCHKNEEIPGHKTATLQSNYWLVLKISEKYCSVVGKIVYHLQ
jgi:hypothetical protein